jgi:hypothetical protein
MWAQQSVVFAWFLVGKWKKNIHVISQNTTSRFCHNWHVIITWKATYWAEGVAVRSVLGSIFIYLAFWSITVYETISTSSSTFVWCVRVLEMKRPVRFMHCWDCSVRSQDNVKTLNNITTQGVFFIARLVSTVPLGNQTGYFHTISRVSCHSGSYSFMTSMVYWNIWYI